VLWVAGAVLVFPLISGRAVLLPIRNMRTQVDPRSTVATQIVGQWNVKFYNGVTG
jgi:hypothetical protein